MAEKQSHLNVGYEGPTVPPTRSYHSHGRRGRSCNGLCCLPCCLLSLVFKIIFSIIVVVGIAALVFWLIFRPTRVKFYAENASLTQFNITNNNMLHYNLALDIRVRNPNKRIGVYYDKIEARAFYMNQRISMVTLPSFYQGHKNTTILHPKFEGQALVPVGSSDLSNKFNRDNGRYEIDVKLYLRIRFKLGRIKTRRVKPKIECDLKVPLASKGGIVVDRFQTTRCKLDF